MELLYAGIYLILVLSSISEVTGIKKEEFYPFGTIAGDQKLPKKDEDVSSSEIRLSTPIKFFSREYTGIYVNENGLLSFLTEIPSFFNVEFPLDYPIIAILYSDIDCRTGGDIWFRTVTNSSELLDRSARDIRRFFPRTSAGFQPEELLIVTWDRVGYFDRKNDKVNSFQIVLASDASKSFAIYHYAENGIEWTKAMGKNRNMPDARAQAGIISGEGAFLALPGSGRDQVQRLDRWSNVNVAGVWAFQLGPLSSLENILQPSTKILDEFMPSTAQSCRNGATLCHSSASCQDYAQGFCCKCQGGWYGNGQTCLPRGFPQRIRGKVKGTINSVPIVDQDLHCYVVADDGRTYTALSKIGKMGPEMQALTPIGTPIAWLFAQSVKDAENGFSLTGGVFNYTAEITFPETRHSAQVKYIFKGQDAFDYLYADVELSGTIPPLERIGTKIRVEDYVEEFTKIQPGLIQSRSTRQVGFEGSSRNLQLDLVQTIQYVGCQYEPVDPSKRTLKLKSTRNYILYDKPEQVVRFAMTSQMIPIDASEDPCTTVQCDANSFCQPEGSVGRCVCRIGFVDDNGHCVDMDECALRYHHCSDNADCFNTPGSFECTCKAGFKGNGLNCIEDKSCEDIKCHPSADCLDDHHGDPICRCWTGYTGDGIHNCQIVPSEVKISSYASPENIQFDLSKAKGDRNHLDHLGPLFHHYYEVINYGPSTIGNMMVQISWPLKDGDFFLTYIPETPFVKYTTATGEEFVNPCQMESEQDVNPYQLTSNGRKRRRLADQPAGEVYTGDDTDEDEDDEDESDDDGDGVEIKSDRVQVFDQDSEPDYDYEPNFGALVNENDMIPDDFDYYIANAAERDYDYSHFEILNMPSGPGKRPTTQKNKHTHSSRKKSNSGMRVTTAKPKQTVADGPQAEKVQIESEFGGNINFRCRINLSPQERGLITIKAHLVTDSLSLVFPSATHFKVMSEVDVLPNDSLQVTPSYKLHTHTHVHLRGSSFARVPGKGITCGNIECNRYADCHVQLDGSSERRLSKCFCLPGFKGNGLNCHRLHAHEDALDCRQSKNCDERAVCSFNRTRELFTCTCQQGFVGNGLTCRQDSEDCSVTDNCSPYATCEKEPDQTFRCKCRPGYNGDGYDCRVENNRNEQTDDQSVDYLSEETQPTCIYSVCICSRGLIYDGNRNCIRDVEATAYREPVARPNCYLGACVCPYGYQHHNREGICKLHEVIFPAGVVHCDHTGIQCGPNGRCVFDRSQDNSICHCNPGFVGDGFECEKMDSKFLESGDCRVNSDCSPDKKCILKSSRSTPGKVVYTCFKSEPRDAINRDLVTRIPNIIPTTTTPIEHQIEPTPNLDMCRSNEDCDVNAECSFNQTEERRVCSCNNFYEGDGFNCRPHKDAGCNIKKDCHKNATCYLDEISLTYYCRCNDGFTGDGYSCKEDVIGCNLIDNCGRFAQCVFDQHEGGYRCKCDHTKGFEGDGYTCKPSVPCWQNPQSCDSNAECVAIPSKARQPEYACRCRPGYVGDGFECQALPKYDGNYLISSQGMALMKVEHDSNSRKPGLPILIKPYMTAGAIAMDCPKGRLYIADTTGKSIHVSNYDGKDAAIFLEDNMVFPEGVAVDEMARNIFWTDSGKRTIEVASLDSRTRKILFDEQIRNPRGIAVHPTLSKIYWTDWDPIHPRIESANFDGSDRRILIDAQIGMPNALAIDIDRQEICWTDGGRQSNHPDKAPVYPKIECMGLNLSNRRPLVEMSSNELPYGLALTDTKVFWTDWKKPGVHVALRSSGERQAVLPHVLSMKGRPFGIINVPNECSQAPSDCGSFPDACGNDKVCLSNGRGGSACLCGDQGKVQGLQHKLNHQQESACKDTFNN